MVVTKLISGLGNQLFQYAIGRQLALDRAVHLKFDTSFFATQKLRSYKLQHFNVAGEVAEEGDVTAYLCQHGNNSLLDRICRKINLAKPKYKQTIFREAEWWLYEPDIFRTPSSVYLDGYWQHYKYFENIAPTILTELTLKEKPPTDAARLLEQVITCATNTPVSVHVRRGDYITDVDAHNFMGVLPTTYYQQAIQYIKTRVRSPHFYFFSDDPNWVKNNLLTEECMSVVEIENGTDYLELEIMSKCAHHIIANSSFSWWGAFLNKSKEKIVIAPKQWVVSNEVNKKIEITFPSWVKL